MKLIIDIDEDYYKAIWENGYIYDEDNEDIAKIIKDGTPLEEELKNIKAEIKQYITENKNAEDYYLSGCGDGAYHSLGIINKHISQK